ncbi:putative Ufm1-specific protease [Schistosoma japonicum]|nr:putative Ufm1-specific protease [Schistosoma japonicum]
MFLKMLLTSAVFVHNNLCLTASSTNEHSSKMLHSFSKLKNSVNLASLVVFFSLDINSSKHTPTLQLSHQPSVGYFHHIPIDLVCDLKDDELIHSALCTKLSSFLDSYHRALLFLWRELQFPPKKLVSYHYVVKSSMYSLRLPRRIKESREGIWRKVIHEKLGFPLDTPLFRRGQALHPVPTIVNWLGPSSELLVCPHEVVKQPPNVGPTYIVTGRYTYKHYLQDGVDDRNWGCAYRSLQTLISWLMWQGEITPGPLPSLRDIQASIVRFGDKPKSFIGSCQWIGSLEDRHSQMSDPTYWTPPDSPEFSGSGDVFPKDLDADILAGIDFDGRQAVPALGLYCDSKDPIEFLSNFETKSSTFYWIEPQQILYLLRSRLVLLKNFTSEYMHDSAALRNDVSSLLLLLYSSIVKKDFERHLIIQLVGCIRSVLSFLGPFASFRKKINENLFHVHLEIWTTVLKIFSFLCDKSEYVMLLNETLGLKPQSSLNACGYFMDIVLENLILYSGLTQKNWFKFFHGKMIKLSTHQKADLFEFNNLECIRPDFKSYFQSSSLDICHQSLTLWSLYWNVLAYTAPIHRLYADYINQSEIDLRELQKYSVVVWLIRQQFLGEATPTNSDVHICLTNLLRLSDTCGINLEVIRTLWLYFKIRLNTGFDISNSSSGSCTPSTSLKISLFSLTKQGISYYFYMWTNLVEGTLDAMLVNTNILDSNKTYLLSLVDYIVEMCFSLSESFNSSHPSLYNWDPNRCCVLLQCLQYLLVICMECLVKRSESNNYFSCLLSIVEKINTVIVPLRCALSPLHQFSTESEFVLAQRSVAFNRLSASNCANDFISISIQFLVDLMASNNSTHISLSSDRILFTIHCLGASYFQSTGWSFDTQWNEYILQLVEAVCLLTYSESNLEIFIFVWSIVYPTFKKAISRQNTKCTPLSINLSSLLSRIAFCFLRLSSICSLFKDELRLTDYLVDPAELFDLFAIDLSIDFSLHFSILKTCYNTSSSVIEILSILDSSRKDACTIAWLFFVSLLTYSLLVRTSITSFSAEHQDDYVFPSFVNEIRAYLPAHINPSMISSLDPETVLINMASSFDELSTFQSRMLFKSIFVKYMGRLCEFICTCCSVSSSAKENGFGLICIPQDGSLKTRDLCENGYRAAGMLTRYCSMLLYAPATTEYSTSIFENLVNHFFLPRQLYESQDSYKLSSHSECSVFPFYVLESIQEQLPEFARGIAQLNWRSDPYLCRIIKDIVKLYYKQLHAEAIASVVLNSPSLDFRTHILQYATFDQISCLVDSKTLIASHFERITYQHDILFKWVKFAYSIFSNTHSNDGYQRDAPFLVCPILLSHTLKDVTGILNSDSRKQCAHILKMYKEAVALVTCKETRLRILELCYNLDKKTMDPSCSLVKFFDLK